MKLLIKGDIKKIEEVCREMDKVKYEEKGKVIERVDKFSTTKRWADFMVRLGGHKALDMSELYDQIAFAYAPVSDDTMELNIPVYIPHIARTLIKGKLVKTFREIFECECGKVEVKFKSWGDEDLRKKHIGNS